MPMPTSIRRSTALAAATVAIGGLAACSSSSNSAGGSSSSNPAPAATSTSSQKITPGGTVNVIANSGPDHWDTVSAYYTPDYEFERIYTRQLVAYPTVPYSGTTSAGWTTDTTPVADAATSVPTTANGGITDGGKVYTFHIKSGVDWDTTPARQVTAADFLREFKAFFNPISPVGNAAYYTSTIAGLQAYDNEETAYFAKIKSPTAAQIAKFQNTHSISGIKASGETITFTLIQPASDFIYMLAMPFASARPVEYDSYLPNSLQLNEHLISDGPYQPTAFVAGKSVTLSQNPAWKQSTDTIRHQYVSKFQLTIDGSSAETQLSDIQAGSQDVVNDTGLNPSSIPALLASKAPNFQVWAGSNTQPYIIFNLRSPNQGGAIQKLALRQAIEYGLDKVAVVRSVGGPEIATIINTVIPPGNTGFVNSNLYPDNNGAGNVTECKTLLGKAGYAKGITLNYLYPNDSVNTRIFEAIQASLATCGITLKGTGEPGSSFFVDLGNAPENNKPGTFDLAQAAWFPDWYGNNGRTVIQALFQGPQCVLNTVNYGCYDNSSVNADIVKAEGASSLTAAGTYWHDADVQIMKDAALVPIMSQNFPDLASKRVRGVLPNGATYQTALYNPNIGEPDLANIWLAS
jgi:peptide/nickel transport system substrate-binding protein